MVNTINSTLSAFDAHRTEPASTKAINPKLEVVLQKASNVIPKPITWIWDQWLPKGKLTILGGAGGTGKTTLALGLAAAITKGGRFPDGSIPKDLGNVLIWSSEDDPDDVLTPRLMAMGADLERIYFVSAMGEGDQKRSFDPATDIKVLGEKVKDIGGVSLLIIDPIVSAVAKDMNQANDVRRSLQPIVDFASDHQCAIIGISHLGKGTQGKDPTERILGSQAFTAFARMVWLTASNKETGDRVLVRSKSNISALDGGFSYTVEQTEISNGIFTSMVLWKDSIDGYAAEILSDYETIGEDKADSELKNAELFLKELLDKESVPTNQVKQESKEGGFSWATIRRAAENIKVKKRKSGMAGCWVWGLPNGDSTPEDAQNTPKMLTQMDEHLREEMSNFDKSEAGFHPESLGTQSDGGLSGETF